MSLQRMSDIEVRSRVPGQAAALPDVRVEILDSTATVRGLIAAAVRAQIAALATAGTQARAALDRHYLTDADISERARHGVIRLGLPRSQAPLDPEREVRRAVDAFAGGIFLVFVGGRQILDLDESLRLGADDRVTFLRLTALQGG